MNLFSENMSFKNSSRYSYFSERFLRKTEFSEKDPPRGALASEANQKVIGCIPWTYIFTMDIKYLVSTDFFK